MKDYYKKQLSRISTAPDCPAYIKLSDDGGDFTNHLSLNEESVAALRVWLDERFPKDGLEVRLSRADIGVIIDVLIDASKKCESVTTLEWCAEIIDKVKAPLGGE